MKYDAMNIITGEVIELEGPVPVFSQFLVPMPEDVETSKSEDTKTEQGYIPPEIQIRDQLRAGLMIEAARRARFDSDLYPEGDLNMDIALDPYRDQSADVVDLVRVAITTGARLREQDAIAKKAAADKEAADREKAADELSASMVGKTAAEIAQLLKQSKAQ